MCFLLVKIAYIVTYPSFAKSKTLSWINDVDSSCTQSKTDCKNKIDNLQQPLPDSNIWNTKSELILKTHQSELCIWRRYLWKRLWLSFKTHSKIGEVVLTLTFQKKIVLTLLVPKTVSLTLTYFEATSISTVLYSGTHNCLTYSKPGTRSSVITFNWWKIASMTKSVPY